MSTATATLREVAKARCLPQPRAFPFMEEASLPRSPRKDMRVRVGAALPASPNTLPVALEVPSGLLSRTVTEHAAPQHPISRALLAPTPLQTHSTAVAHPDWKSRVSDGSTPSDATQQHRVSVTKAADSCQRETPTPRCGKVRIAPGRGPRWPRAPQRQRCTLCDQPFRQRSGHGPNSDVQIVGLGGRFIEVETTPGRTQAPR